MYVVVPCRAHFQAPCMSRMVDRTTVQVYSQIMESLVWLLAALSVLRVMAVADPFRTGSRQVVGPI